MVYPQFASLTLLQLSLPSGLRSDLLPLPGYSITLNPLICLVFNYHNLTLCFFVYLLAAGFTAISLVPGTVPGTQ